ncbi:MAG: hypothetical protein DSY90_06455 [Deltaproteobacteria bacterium]|nr:MAG: hypothetical protein DSY90_06455 [Deltaproteobacteria bacterium]
MEDGFYQYALRKTDGFVFSDDGTHNDRVRRLVTQVRKMAITYFYQTPAAFAREFDQDDWVQHAMIHFFKCIETYDRKRPFDNFVRYIVKRRLEDQRRRLYRSNPETDTGADGRPSRFFSGISASIQRKAEADPAAGPEQDFLRKEAARILLKCVRQLEKVERMLFAKHEMENVSFRKLYDLVPGYAKSFATFKRWYQTNIFDRVKTCTRSRLPE